MRRRLGGWIEAAKAGGWTPSLAVQAAWGMVLARQTGRQDVVFGTTVSGRPPELAGVFEAVGLFINTVPVRVRLDPAESVRQLLRRLRGEQTRLLDHHHLSLAEIGAADFFDTVTVFENWPEDGTDAAAGSGLQVDSFEIRSVTHYPIYLAATPARAGAAACITGRIGSMRRLVLSCSTGWCGCSRRLPLSLSAGWRPSTG